MPGGECDELTRTTAIGRGDSPLPPSYAGPSRYQRIGGVLVVLLWWLEELFDSEPAIHPELDMAGDRADVSVGAGLVEGHLVARGLARC
jgi:hypothetical protein